MSKAKPRLGKRAVIDNIKKLNDKYDFRYVHGYVNGMMDAGRLSAEEASALLDSMGVIDKAYKLGKKRGIFS